MARNWIKPGITLLVLALIMWIAPVAPLDPWNLVSPKKIATMILALATIQVLGSAMAEYLGDRTGAILTGFFGGIISSTATTASLARRSKISPKINGSDEVLTFLSATAAMLFEGLALLIAGASNVQLSTILIFTGPLLATFAMAYVQYRLAKERSGSSETSTFKILPILKLSLFIFAILSVSKICQNIFGQNGLLVLTSFVSLFEIHGSIIANVQLYDSGEVTARFLCSLLSVSILASYTSKLFIIATLGSTRLRSSVIKSSLILFCALAISWAAAISLA